MVATAMMAAAGCFDPVRYDHRLCLIDSIACSCLSGLGPQRPASGVAQGQLLAVFGYLTSNHCFTLIQGGVRAGDLDLVAFDERESLARQETGWSEPYVNYSGFRLHHEVRPDHLAPLGLNHFLDHAFDGAFRGRVILRHSFAAGLGLGDQGWRSSDARGC